MEYKALKKIISALENVLSSEESNGFTMLAAPHPDENVPLHLNPASLQEFQALRTAFFFKLERELEKVQYPLKLNLQVNNFYLQKESDFKIRIQTLSDKKRVYSARRSKKQALSLLHSLREAYTQFQNDLAKLQVGVVQDLFL